MDEHSTSTILFVAVVGQFEHTSVNLQSVEEGGVCSST